MVPTKVIKSDKSSVYSIKFIHCVSFKVFTDYIESFFWPQLNSKLKFVCIVHHIVSHSSTIFSVVAASLLMWAQLCISLYSPMLYERNFLPHVCRQILWRKTFGFSFPDVKAMSGNVASISPHQPAVITPTNRYSDEQQLRIPNLTNQGMRLFNFISNLTCV